MSLTDYVDEVNVVIDRASSRYYSLVGSREGQVLIAERTHLSDFAPQDLQAALAEVRDLESDVRDSLEDIEPPEQVAELHQRLFDFSVSIPVLDALAARAGTAVSWEELSESPEMAAYRAQLAEDKERCTDFQTELDDTSARGAFADTPWVPAELKEVVDAALGCVGFPESPENLYRPLSPSAP
jgi:hypothetical protein